MPSRPVALPNRTARLPGPGAAARVRWRSSSSPIAITLTSGLSAYDGIEHELAADRGHADAVAVAADAANDAVDEVPRPRVGRVAEAQGIEDGDRAGAHREDVAQDPADAGRGALVRLDRGRDGCAIRA